MSEDDTLADITERLRRAAPFMRATGNAGIVGQHANTCEEAADEIERLRAVIADAASLIDGHEQWGAERILIANQLRSALSV